MYFHKYCHLELHRHLQTRKWGCKFSWNFHLFKDHLFLNTANRVLGSTKHNSLWLLWKGYFDFHLGMCEGLRCVEIASWSVAFSHPVVSRGWRTWMPLAGGRPACLDDLGLWLKFSEMPRSSSWVIRGNQDEEETVLPGSCRGVCKVLLCQSAVIVSLRTPAWKWFT